MEMNNKDNDKNDTIKFPSLKNRDNTIQKLNKKLSEEEIESCSSNRTQKLGLPSNTEDLFVERREPKLISFKRKVGSSTFKGVMFVKSQNKWRAQICLGGKKKYVGSYNTEIEAGLARDQKVRELFGDCNKDMLNFPLKPYCVPCFRAQNLRQNYRQHSNMLLWNNISFPEPALNQRRKLSTSSSCYSRPSRLSRNSSA